MTRFRLPAILLLSSTLTYLITPSIAQDKHPAGIGPSFKGPVGLQLYSLRNQFAKDVPGTLDKVRDFGIQYVELAGTYGLTPAEFKKQLDARGLKAISAHFPYEQLRDHVEDVARDAKNTLARDDLRIDFRGANANSRVLILRCDALLTCPELRLA